MGCAGVSIEYYMPPSLEAERKMKNGSLAQLVEQLTFNQLVAGSNPARPTNFSYTSKRCEYVVNLIDGSLAQLVEQLTFNQLVAGSNPARPTIF